MRGAKSCHSRPLGSKSDDKIRLFYFLFFYNLLCQYFNPFFISELPLACGEQQNETMGQVLCVAGLFLGLSAELLEFTYHTRLSPVPYGTACHQHQQSRAEASACHSRNLEPASDTCFHLIHVLNAYIRSNTVQPFGLAFDLAV